MVIRSASLPSLSGLVAECDCYGFWNSGKAPLLSALSPFSIKLGSPLNYPFKPALDLRRARSQIDLQAVLHQSDVSGRRNVKEATGDRSAEKPSTREEGRESLVSFTREGVLSSTEEHAHSSSVFHSRLSTDCSHFSFEVGNTGSASSSSKPDKLLASLGGTFGGRGGKRAGYGGADGSRNNFHGLDPDSPDVRYQKLLQSDPENPLLLRNYAQFLSEAKQDYERAEAYYERAILACPSDGEILSMYAKHVWNAHKDAERAGNYFDWAVKASPDDCYILGSHASFLWESEEMEELEDKSRTIIPQSQMICSPA